MGGSRFSSDDWNTYTTKKGIMASSTTQSIYKSRCINDELNPLNIKVRESRDSDINPNSTPIIIALDVTGSMGIIATEIAKNGLKVLAEEIYNRKPVTDPHIMFLAIGDGSCDDAPIQATQFEAGFTPLMEQLQNVYVEGGGGGNGKEDYSFAWYFAKNKVEADTIIKRNKKGYLFTIGDEPLNDTLKVKTIKKFIGDSLEKDVDSISLLAEVQRNWEVFHLIITEGSEGRSSSTHTSWTNALGERALKVNDYKKVAEVIVSTIEVVDGKKDAVQVANSWDGKTKDIVISAISGLKPVEYCDDIVFFK